MSYNELEEIKIKDIDELKLFNSKLYNIYNNNKLEPTYILYYPKKIKHIIIDEYKYKLYNILYNYIINNNIQSFKIFTEDYGNYKFNLINFNYKAQKKLSNINYNKFNLFNICNHRPELIESLLIEM